MEKSQALVQTLSTLEDLYLDLETAKNEELHMHTIPFYSKEGSGGSMTHAVQITTFGDNILDLDPQTEEGSKVFKAMAGRIARQCGEILGYRWRYILF